MFLLLGATTMANEEAIPSSPLGPGAEENIENTVLIPCTICGRTFKSESLLKHQTVCQKNATKKRRVFDSMKQRIQGTELAEYIPIPVVPPKPKLIPVNKVAAKKVSKDEQRTGESPSIAHRNPAGTDKTPVRPTVTRSNSTGISGARSGGAALREERCPHCDRTFGWKAFSRHEEWCREHKSRLAQAQSPAAVLKAKEMLEARIKYRAPTIGKIKRPTNREKYSGATHTSPAVHSVHKMSVDDSPVISSMKATVSSTNKIVSESRARMTPKTSVSQSHSTVTPSSHQPVTPSNAGPGSTPRRGLSPTKKISRVIQNPWLPSIGVDQSSGGDENISSALRSRNNHSPENGGNSKYEEEYDKLFSRIPVLEYSEDNDKDEELLRWIRNVKALLKNQNKAQSIKDSEKRALGSPVSQSKAEKMRQWEIKSTASDEKMKRTFVYKPLDSSDESVDYEVGASSNEISSQNEEVNVLYSKETQKQMKDRDSKNSGTDTAAGCNQTIDKHEEEATLPNPLESRINANDENTWPPRHSLSKSKKGKVDNSPPKITTPSVIHNISGNANISPGFESVGAFENVSPDSHLGNTSDKGQNKKEKIAKRRSKLPVPVSKFGGQQKNKIFETTKGTNSEVTTNDMPIDFIANMPKFSSKSLNNTFILPKKALEECSFGVPSHSGVPNANTMEVDSLESSSGDTSPLLQKGIIHKCEPEMSEANLPAEECMKHGKSTSRREDSFDSGKCSVEESCSIPIHLLVKNNDSSQENTNVTDCCDDFNGKNRNNLDNLFEDVSSRSSIRGAKSKASLNQFSDSNTYHCKLNNDSACNQSWNMSANRETGSSPHCLMHLFDNQHDSPLEMDDLATDVPSCKGGYSNSKILSMLSSKNDNKMDTAAHSPSIKVHYLKKDGGEERYGVARKLDNETEITSPRTHITCDINPKDTCKYPHSSCYRTSKTSSNEKVVQSNEEELKRSRHYEDAQPSVMNAISACEENISDKEGSSDDFTKSYFQNKKGHVLLSNDQEEGMGRSTDQELEMSIDKRYLKNLRGERSTMKSLGNENEGNVCQSTNMVSDAHLQLEKVDETVKGYDEGVSRALDMDGVTVQQKSSEGNLSVDGITYEASSMSNNMLSCESCPSQDHMLGSSMSSTSMYSNLAYPGSKPSSKSNPKTSKRDLTLMVRKYTESPCGSSKRSPSSRGNYQYCSTISSDESSVSLSKVCSKKLKNRKRRGKASIEDVGSVQGKNEDEVTKVLQEQSSPAAITMLKYSGNGRCPSEGSVNVAESSTGHLHTVSRGSGFSSKISAGNNITRVENSQRKWLNLIRKLSESEIGCIESVEEVVTSNENLLPQEKGISKKSSSFGWSRNDRKAAEDRVKSRLLGENQQSRPSSQNVRSSPSPWSSASSRKMVALPSPQPLPKMVANGKPNHPIPSSPVPPQPNLKHVRSSPVKSAVEEKGVGGSESAPALAIQPPSRLSTYDPFSRAEMQLKELLSDGTEAQAKAVLPTVPPAVAHPDDQPAGALQNGAHEKLEDASAKINGNINIHDIYINQKQAKEVELPDLFTETSAQLDFEMPNVMRSRERSVNTKRRSLKPTAQNMGIELDTIGRDRSVGRRDTVVNNAKDMGNKFEDEEVEQITSIMNMGFCIPRMSSGGNAKSSPGDELDIDSIHQSINLVALGLTNLSASSRESMADKDNNNESGGRKGESEVDFSGNVVKEAPRIGGVGRGRVESSGDSDSEGGLRAPRRVRARPRALAGKGGLPAVSVEGDLMQERGSSGESLTATQPLISGKPSVDSAYNSLNRPIFRTIEQAKEATTKAFDLHHHSVSSEGENDHADEWSDDEGGKKTNQNRWNAETKSSSAVKFAKFCHNCGSKYPLSEAKFCCVCGAQRLSV